jgi:hypothetical protein
MSSIREIRIIIQNQGVLRKLFKVAFSQKDASLYFFPYGPKGKYYYGNQSMQEYEIKQTFSFIDQFHAEKIPKLSIHESGQIHIYCGKNALAGPLCTLPLNEWRGEHIATLSTDTLDSLAEHKKEIKTTGPEIDYIIPSDDSVESARIAVYCNGQSPIFDYRHGFAVHLKRPTLQFPLYVGFTPIPQSPLAKKPNGGITVIAGWNPQKGKTEKQDYLYIRAQ